MGVWKIEKRLDQLFNLLDIWRLLPKYQLERRVDIFFALYLPEILKNHVDPPLLIDVTTNVIPEFPLNKNESFLNLSKNNESCNVDYAIFPSEGTTVYFIELKTDMDSITEDQVKYLCIAQKKGITNLLEGIIAMYQKSHDWRKYDTLLTKLAEIGLVVCQKESVKEKKDIARRGVWRIQNKVYDKIKVIYIQPESATEKQQGYFEEFKAETGEKVSVITFSDVVDRLKNSEETDPVVERFKQSLEKWRENPL